MRLHKKSNQIATQILCITGICVLFLSACKTPVFEPDLLLKTGSGTEVHFPLEQPLLPGYSGDFYIAPASDGSSYGRLQLSGLNPSKRYFGKISRTDASNPNLVIDIADLHEIDPETGKSEMQIRRDYQNRTLLFDSLLNKEAVIRILEINPNGGLPSEVLRGDFGSNVILEEKREVQVASKNGSGISGSLEIRRRKNGRWLINGKVQNIPAQMTLRASYFSGNVNGVYQKQASLGSFYADVADKFRFGFPVNLPGFSSLDTLNGFIGFENADQPVDSVKFLAVANFGGNNPTGRSKTYPIYSASDSSLVAKLEFEEFGQMGSPLRLTINLIQPIQGQKKYLSLHRGTWLDQVDTIWSVALPEIGNLEIAKVPNGSGSWLRFEDLDAWNTNARLAEDASGQNNVYGIADLGGNEILKTDSLFSVLNESNPAFGINGNLIFRPRKNGHVFSAFYLSNTQAGVENTILIRLGPKPALFTDTTVATHRVAIINGINPGTYKGFSNLEKITGTPGTWSELMAGKNTGSYLEFNFSDGGDFFALCRGNL